MIKLYGIKEEVYQPTIGSPFEVHEEKELVATFDSVESAQAYVKSARLKKEKRASFSGTVRYHSKSVLAGCADYEIENDESLYIPHNPSFV